jgi:hypothetical protein
LRLLREVVAPEVAEVYPQFAAQVFGVRAHGLNDGNEARPMSAFQGKTQTL